MRIKPGRHTGNHGFVKLFDRIQRLEGLMAMVLPSASTAFPPNDHNHQ